MLMLTLDFLSHLHLKDVISTNVSTLDSLLTSDACAPNHAGHNMSLLPSSPRSEVASVG